MDVAFNHLSTFEDYQTKITNWGAKLIRNYSTKHKSFISANDMLRLTVGSDFVVTETKTEIFLNITDLKRVNYGLSLTLCLRQFSNGK